MVIDLGPCLLAGCQGLVCASKVNIFSFHGGRRGHLWETIPSATSTITKMDNLPDGLNTRSEMGNQRIRVSKFEDRATGSN